MTDHRPHRGVYEGFAQGPDLGPIPSGSGALSSRVEGRISLLRGKVRFEGPAATFDIDLTDTTLRLGGADDDLVFFADTKDPRRTIYTPDRSVLADPEIRRDPRLSAQARKIRRTRSLGRALLVAIPLALLFSLVLLWLSRGLLVGFVVDRVPLSWERSVGSALASGLIEPQRVEDEALQQATRDLAAPLVRAMDAAWSRGDGIVLTLIDDESINAFAIPGGFIGLHTGLVLEAESIAEIQGVLAHELAHVEGRHSLRQLVDTAGLVLFVQALFGDLSGLAALAIDGGRELLTLEHSRDAELEADTRALELLRAADLDPAGLPRFLQRIRDAGTDLPRALTFLSTHPNSQARIDRLTEVIGPTTERNPRSAELEALQERVRGATSRYEAGRKLEGVDAPVATP